MKPLKNNQNHLNENVRILQEKNQKQSQQIEELFRTIMHIKNLYHNLNKKEEVLKCSPRVQDQMTFSTMNKIFKFVNVEQLLKLRLVSAKFNNWIICVLPFSLELTKNKLSQLRTFTEDCKYQINQQKQNMNQFEHIRQKVTNALATIQETDVNIIRRTFRPNSQVTQVISISLCLIKDKEYVNWSDIVKNLDDNYIWNLVIWNIWEIKEHQLKKLEKILEVDEEKLIKKSEKVFRIYEFLKYMLEYIGVSYILKGFQLQRYEKELKHHEKIVNGLQLMFPN